MTAEVLLNGPRIPQHVAIIMDGNGRWAKQRGLPRLAGHRAGTENIRSIVKACSSSGVRYLTLYAFSTENWHRPSAEVEGLMRILSEFVDRETTALHEEGVKIRHLGSLVGVSEALGRKITAALELTRNNKGLTLAIAFNYGGRSDLVDAVRALLVEGIKPDALTEQLLADHLSTRGIPDPDLVVRTSGESRLSNFLIWETAYSEYWTTALFWPDFGPDQLLQAIKDYGRRERRFGKVTEKS